MEFVFRVKDGHCPECIAFGKIYYIQDKYIGNEKYEYALMSRPVEKNVAQKFKDVKKVVSFFIGKDITDDITANLLLSQMTVYQCNSYLMIEQDGVKYVWDSQKKELREYTEPKQETGYYDTYSECLQMAKKLLHDLEISECGRQLSLAI